jgi:hypothetical protein
MKVNKFFLSALLLTALPCSSFSQVYEKYNVIRVISYKPRPGSCYNPAPGLGHYPCLVVPMGVLIRQQNGKEASVCCTEYKLDGSFVENVQKDFGQHSRESFKAVQQSISSYTISPGHNLDAAVLNRLKGFADALNLYKSGMDLENKPESIYNYIASSALFELTEAFMRADGTSAEKLAFIEKNHNTANALFEISGKGIANISTSLLPFISDARDFYELVNGRDLITGEPIDGFGRIVSGVALIAGSGEIYRKAVNKLKESFFKKALNEAAVGIPGLKYTGEGGWVSDAGIVYRKTLKKEDGTISYENNLRHVLRHCSPNPSKPNHTVFAATPKGVPRLIDEAWAKKGAAISDPGAEVYIVDMGKVIGTRGEKKLRIVLEKGTRNITTAYPQM